MKISMAEKRNVIQWTLWTQLDDLYFADDLALLSHTQQQMQEKTTTVADNSTRPQHPQREEQGPEGQHHPHITHHVGRRSAGRGG